MIRKTKNDSNQLEQVKADVQSITTEIALSFGNKNFSKDSPEAARLIKLLHKRGRLLQDHIDLIEKDNARLKDANLRLENDRDRLRLELRLSMGFKESKNKSTNNIPITEVKNSSGKRGSPVGHKGRSRSLPDTWNTENVVTEVKKCSCGCKKIAALDEYDYKYIEDIIPARKTVTQLIYRRGRCSRCDKIVRHPDVFAGPPVVIGKNLAAHLAILRQKGITYRQLSKICNETLGIQLTAPAILGIVSRVTDSLNPVYEQIASSLPEQEIIHADETSWKVRGNGHYIWMMCNRELAYYHIDKSRSSAVPKNLIGEKYEGIVVCDFYAGYNFLPKTQRCLVHLLRDIKKERQLLPGSVAIKNFEERMHSFIKLGKQIQKMNDKDLQGEHAQLLRKELVRIGKMRMPAHGKGKALAKRILKYQDDIFRFVENSKLEWHNNRAERQIRPLVVSRKMSFGSDTIGGARRNCVLQSIVATCYLNDLKPLDFIRDIFLKNKPIYLPFL